MNCFTCAYTSVLKSGYFSRTLLTQSGPWPPTSFTNPSSSPTGTIYIPFFRRICSNFLNATVASPAGIAEIPEDFKAWRHGPVIPSLYRMYRRFGSDRITPPETVELSHFTSEEKDLLESVWLTYGGYSAWGLRNLSHDSAPWKSHKDDGSVIPKEEMRLYFLTLNDEK